ncbi:MAG: flagellin, partial [Oscillospiraceae bacterium]
ALSDEITRIANQTEFNTKTLLTGTLSGTANELKFQVGANSGQTVNLGIGNMKASALGVQASAVGVGTAASSTKSIKIVNDAIEKVSSQRSKLGAMQNRLEHTIANLNNTSENLQAAESRVRDVDMAKEMMNFSKNNILNQAAQAMLAQANQQPQAVLQLLR